MRSGYFQAKPTKIISPQNVGRALRKKGSRKWANPYTFCTSTHGFVSSLSLPLSFFFLLFYNFKFFIRSLCYRYYLFWFFLFLYSLFFFSSPLVWIFSCTSHSVFFVHIFLWLVLFLKIKYWSVHTQIFNKKCAIFWFFFFFVFWESFNLWRPYLMIALYYQTKTPINFWYRQRLNFRSLIQPSETFCFI